MEFSERFGYASPKFDLADDAMPDSLRNGLWDCCRMTFFEKIETEYSRHTESFNSISDRIWFHHYRLPVDSKGVRPKSTLDFIRERFFAANFSQVYEFIEFLANLNVADRPCFIRDGNITFGKFCNLVLEREMAAFRFAETILVKVVNEEDRNEIESALQQNKSGGVKAHISAAASLYSKTPNPDYRNSIKESISAVESAVGFVLGEKPNGMKEPLRAITDKFGMHHALRDGFIKLYGYTSDAEGIRHALMEEDNLTQEDARYMLVSCSAFSNYLLALKARG